MKLVSKRNIYKVTTFLLTPQKVSQVDRLLIIITMELNNLLSLANYCAENNVKMENYIITVHTNGSLNFINITKGIIKCLFFKICGNSVKDFYCVFSCM